MFEKKKKRDEGSYRWLRYILLLAIYCAGFGGGVLMYLLRLPQSESAPLYPAPPEKVIVSVPVEVVDSQGQPVPFRNIHLSVRVDSGDADGIVVKGNPAVNTITKKFRLDSDAGGCIWGSIEIKEAVWQDFEFGLGNMEWGAVVSVRIVTSATGTAFNAVASPAAIKPALAPAPMMYPACSPQLQYPLSVTPIPSG